MSGRPFTIPLHVVGSRWQLLEQPDWCILDLDPRTAPFEHVVMKWRAPSRIYATRSSCRVIKTSGSTGLHVRLRCALVTFEQARQLAGCWLA